MSSSETPAASGQIAQPLWAWMRWDARRRADAIYLWAFAALSASPGARIFYDCRRAAGDTHHAALRALGNRLVGILHGCLNHHSTYNENIAWAHRTEQETNQAA